MSPARATEGLVETPKEWRTRRSAELREEYWGDLSFRNGPFRVAKLQEEHALWWGYERGLEEQREVLARLIVVGSAATGFLMCPFPEMHEYVERIMGRPVYTHEMGNEAIFAEIRAKAKGDFVQVIEQARALLARSEAQR